MNSFMEPFSSHWRITKDGISKALGESLIVLDSSVLLDLYRVTPSARKEMINSLHTVRENLWIPHQVALEFHSNRVEAAQDQLNFYNETCKALEAAQNQALQRLNEFANRSALDAEEKRDLKGPLEQAFREAMERVRSHQGVFDLTLGRVLNDDPVLKALAHLLDGRVGQSLPEEDHERALGEASRRKEARIPPGYKDRAKRNNSAGDYIWWEQTLIMAAEIRKPVLIISNDEKEDWLNKRIDFPLGPREELIQEMNQRADVSLRIVSFPAFLEAIKTNSSVPVSRETLSQANIARRQSEERSKRIICSRALVEDYLTFMGRAIGRYEEELKRNLVERGKITDDPDGEAILESDIRRVEYAISMYRDRAAKLAEAIDGASSLNGNLALRIEDDSLRLAVIKRMREAQAATPD
ncbi:PIN-like domain-containing protein [Streptomyces sp. IMTB 2501]|uniref:PIN-like domain-containing protein n=1 Tax=Streptomyces sp. IMTB 2501 TaxID=1776340 RepID=UPI001180ABC9|nr:PIN-like domain-containing protein [Streptomyces sp. IMTB 2501]